MQSFLQKEPCLSSGPHTHWKSHPKESDFSKYPKIRIQSKQCSSVKCNYEVTLVKMNRDLLFMLRLMSFSEVDWKQTPVAHVLSISALRTFVVDSVLWRAVLWTVQLLTILLTSKTFVLQKQTCLRTLTNVSYKIKVPLIEYHSLRTSSVSGTARSRVAR